MSDTEKVMRIRTLGICHRLTIAVAFYGGLLCLMLILLVDVDLFEDELSMDVLFILLLIFALGVLTRHIIVRINKAILTKSVSDFTRMEPINGFAECRPLYYHSIKRHKHAVLLLHGFTSSPMEFMPLSKELNKKGVDYYAPLIPGFGQIHPEMLTMLRKEDWFRQVLFDYDMLSNRFDKISVVGHSMGGLLACLLAQHRKVHHLILSAPALFPQGSQMSWGRLLRFKWLMHFIAWLIPMFPKPLRGDRGAPVDTLDTDSSLSYFQYVVTPVSCLFAMLEAQEQVDVSKLQYDTLTLLYGKHDITVDNHAIEQSFRKAGLTFNTCCFERSAHNIFVDYERETVCTTVVDILSSIMETNDEGCKSTPEEHVRLNENNR